jgi:hypothetical protein
MGSDDPAKARHVPGRAPKHSVRLPMVLLTPRLRPRTDFVSRHQRGGDRPDACNLRCRRRSRRAADRHPFDRSFFGLGQAARRWLSPPSGTAAGGRAREGDGTAGRGGAATRRGYQTLSFSRPAEAPSSGSLAGPPEG